MKIPYIMITALLFTSCGGFKIFGSKSTANSRDIASIAIKQLASEESQTFSDEIDERLLSLHSYHVIAQSELRKFDDLIPSEELKDLHQSSPYLSLTATRTQMDEIEDDMLALWTSLKETKTKASSQKTELLLKRMSVFSESSHLAALTVRKLEEKLDLKLSYKKSLEVTPDDIQSEYKRLEVSKEFQIYEKNIEHLSHLMSTRQKKSVKTFKPSTLDQGEVNGSEFPAKVWALTFNDGPSEKASRAIVTELKKHQLQATFFQVANHLEKHKKVARHIKEEGMEIGAHSYSHKLLTVVGSLTLDKEITSATVALEKNLNIDVRFFRLPYGVGSAVPNIRQKLVENNLIHVGYTVDTLDWVVQSPDKIIKRARAMMMKTPKDSGIILFHDTYQTSIEASSAIMSELKENGRRACSVGEIVKQMNEGVETVCPKS